MPNDLSSFPVTRKWPAFPQVPRALDAFVARPAVQRGLAIPPAPNA